MGMAIHQDQGIPALEFGFCFFGKFCGFSARWRFIGAEVHRGDRYDVIYNESGGPKNMGQLLVRPILSTWYVVGFSNPY